MKVSVCIFTYNHEKFIAQAIESALSQVTEFEYEIVIGEDCSTDNTRSIIEAFRQRYPEKIVPIYNPTNLGMMANNSNTIMQCRGEYIALMDGDDYWTCSFKLKRQADLLDTHQQYVLCFHDAGVLDLQGKMMRRTCCDQLKKQVVSFTDIVYNVSIPTLTLMFRRSELEGYPPAWFNDLNAPDRPLFLMLAHKGPGLFIKENWGVYRKHLNGAWTGQHYQSQWLTHLQIYKVMNRYFKRQYEGWFGKYETRVYYTLAVRLIMDMKSRRAVCFFRKFRQKAGTVRVAHKVLLFGILYFCCRLRILYAHVFH
jgi:glycosyltransferase involved in cell wall biosynthesis